MVLLNDRDSRVVAASVEIADTHAKKRRGLLGRESLPGGSAIVLPSCNAVHTVGMRFTIDVAFVDGRGLVRKIVRNLVPWRIAVAPTARTTIEFAAGELERRGVNIGDRLYLGEAP
jgi:hypothetical protein